MKQLSPFLGNNPEMFEQRASRNPRINKNSSGHFWNDRLITKSPNCNFKAALHKYPTVTSSLHERALDSSNRKASRCWTVTGPTRRGQTLRPPSWSPLVRSDTSTPASCWRSFCSGCGQHVPLCTKEHLLVPPMGSSPVQVSWNELLLFRAVDLFWRSQTLIFKVVLSNTSAAFWKSSGFFFGLCDFSSLVLIPEDL